MITGKTAVFSILGDPVEQALSPIVHNAAFAKKGMDAVFTANRVTVETLPEAIIGVRALGIAGLSVTMPLKTAVIAHLDGCEEKIKCLKAVNTVTCVDGKLIGYNTDGDGFVQNLKAHGQSPKGRNVFLFGAGGVARGISYAVLEAGAAKLTICDINPEWAHKLLEDLQTAFDTPMAFVPMEDTAGVAQGCKEAGLLVNASSMGMGDVPSSHMELIPWADLNPEALLCADVVHKPVETKFVLKARELGFQTFTGDQMLVQQGVFAFKLLTGEDIDAPCMEQAIKDWKKETKK